MLFRNDSGWKSIWPNFAGLGFSSKFFVRQLVKRLALYQKNWNKANNISGRTQIEKILNWILKTNYEGVYLSNFSENQYNRVEIRLSFCNCQEFYGKLIWELFQLRCNKHSAMTLSGAGYYRSPAEEQRIFKPQFSRQNFF